MASRRMKMKVAVNVGRGGRVPGPSTAGSDRGRPTTPINHDLLLPSLSPRSPVKNFQSNFQFADSGHTPTSPTKSPAASVPSPARKSVSESEPEDDTHVFHEEEVSGIELEPFQTRVRSPALLAVRSPSPIKNVFRMSDDESQRGPGSGPSLTASTNTSILTNMQKEIGPVHVGHVTSNETLRQRLQKGTSSNTTKYSILRKEFLVTNKNKKPEKKDLTILHFTFWNPPNEDEDKKPDGDEDFYEGIDTSAMTVADGSAVPFSPPPASVEEAPKKPVGPRVKVGPDGELIIDEKSLVVETTESVRAKKQLSEMETVMAASSGYYRHKRNTRRGYDWTVKETVRFFKALTMCGTDFSMMTHLFPTRTRAELKAKFKREDRKNSALVSQALSFQTFDPMESMTESEESEPELSPPKKRRTSVIDKEGHSKAVNLTDNNNATKLPDTTESGTPNDEEVPIEKLQHPTSVGFCPSSTDASTPLNHSPGDLYPKRRGRKAKVTHKQPKLSKLPDFTIGRPMGLGDLSKAKSIFKVPQAERKVSPKPWRFETSGKPEGVKKKKKRSLTTEQKKSDDKPSFASEVGQEESVEAIPVDPRLAILRFDASDPLGLKVVQTQPVPLTPEEHVDSSSSNTLEVPTVLTEENVLQPPDEPKTPPRVARSTRSMKVKVKPRIPRVPGGGGPVTDRQSPVPGTGGDEIEIEISCL